MAQRKTHAGSASGSGGPAPALAGYIPPNVGEGVVVAGIGGWVDTKHKPVTVDQPMPPIHLCGISLPFSRGFPALHPTISKWFSHVRIGVTQGRGSLVLPGGRIERIGNPLVRHFIAQKILRVAAGKKRKRPPYTLAPRHMKSVERAIAPEPGFHFVTALAVSESEASRQFARRLQRPHLAALIAGLCVGGARESLLISYGYCLLSDPLFLAASDIHDDIRLAMVECAQEGHTGDFLKLVTLWRCARHLDRKAALEFMFNGAARWSRPVTLFADEACGALEPDPSIINDWRVNTDNDRHLFSPALLDVLGMLTQTRVIWTACHCAHAFGSDAVDTIHSPAEYVPTVSTRPLVVDNSGTMTAQQARLILATRCAVEFRGSLLTGSFGGLVKTGLPALVVMVYCYNLARVDPAQPVYRTTLGMLIHPPKTPRKSVTMVENTLEALLEKPKPIKCGTQIDTRPLYSLLRTLCVYSAVSDSSSSISLSE